MEEKKHKGEIIKRIIKNSGRTLIYVALKMGINRNTLYNRFKQPNLTAHFLFRLGRVLNYDITKDFPELRSNELYQRECIKTPKDVYSEELELIRRKHYRILEDYNKLLKFLVKIVNENELYSLKNEIAYFIEQHMK